MHKKKKKKIPQKLYTTIKYSKSINVFFVSFGEFQLTKKKKKVAQVTFEASCFSCHYAHMHM